jgi:hypothetical protein
MATKKVKRLYTVYYNDQSYLSYMLTKDEYEALGQNLGYELNIETSVGYLNTSNMRSIILQKSAPKQKDNASANPDLSKEEQEWINATKLAERLSAEPQEFDDDDVDYEGGNLIV